MKVLLLIILSSFSLISISQKSDQKEYLVSYGQVWGFLKYFHPAPSAQDWDSVLLKDYESLIHCSDHEAFNKIISGLIAQCGSYTPLPRTIADSLQFKESYEWIGHSPLLTEHQSYLVALLHSKPSFKNKYISGTPAGLPKFDHEVTYGEYTFYPAMQYLAITRYWNIINYFCPNRNLIPRDWTQVYRDHVDEFISATKHDQYYFAIRKLTSEIRDGHGFVRTENDPLNNYKYAPFYCVKVSEGYYINTVFQDGVQTIDLKKKDQLISIDGVPVDKKIKEWGTILSTSNDYCLSNATHYLRITDQDSITITVLRKGQLLTNTYATMDGKTMMSGYNPTTPHPKIETYRFLRDSISGKEYLYVDMGLLERTDINRSFKRKLSKTDHLILDIRNYPNWTVLKLSDLLLKGKRKFAKFLTMDFDYPGSYYWRENQTIGSTSKGYEGHIYVLVDYYTKSQAEYTVMALQQHPNTVVIGGQTAGADGNICSIPLPFGVNSVYSGLGVFYPDGTPTQQIGIHRDYEVVRSIKFLEGEDEILEKAIELIRKE